MPETKPDEKEIEVRRDAALRRALSTPPDPKTPPKPKPGKGSKTRGGSDES